MNHDSLIGRQLGAFRVEHKLGSGGMAVVYYGWDVKLNRPVAIKVINTVYRDDPTYAERFVQEARTVANWRHENIIQIYYADDVDGLYYFAMEYIDGQNLADILSSYTADGELVPYEDVLMVTRAIARSLDYAHQKGVIHRDVKPSNIFIERGGRVVLGDFGLSLNLSQGSMGEIFGSAHYIAPEQARRSNAAVPASDLYSLGVILYEMLTGVVPFDDPSPSAVALMHMTAPPPPPRQINPNLTHEIEAVLLKALSKSPSDRYSSAEALINTLEGAMKSEAVQTAQRFALPPLPAGASLATPKTLSKLNMADFVDHSPKPYFGAPVLSLAPSNPPPDQPQRHVPTQTLPSLRLGKLSWLAVFSGCGLALVFFAVLVGGLLLASQWDRGSLSAYSSASPTITANPAPAGLPAYTQTPKNKPTAPTAASTQPSVTVAAALPTETTAAAQPSSTLTPAPIETMPPAAATSVSPLATVRYPDGRPFTFFYDETGFFLLQVDGAAGAVTHITFERLGEKDKPLNTFNGKSWAKFSATTRAGWCMQILLLGVSHYNRPKDCSNQYLSTRYVPADDKSVFWTSQPGSLFFRVLWKNEEVARCEISVKTCEVRLP